MQIPVQVQAYTGSVSWECIMVLDLWRNLWLANTVHSVIKNVSKQSPVPKKAHYRPALCLHYGFVPSISWSRNCIEGHVWIHSKQRILTVEKCLDKKKWNSDFFPYMDEDVHYPGTCYLDWLSVQISCKQQYNPFVSEYLILCPLISS